MLNNNNCFIYDLLNLVSIQGYLYLHRTVSFLTKRDSFPEQNMTIRTRVSPMMMSGDTNL